MMSKSKKVFFCAFMAVVFSCSASFAGSFTDQSATLAPGMTNDADGDKATWGDYNNDGHLDMVTGATLWRNPGNPGAGNPFVSMGGVALYSVWGDYNNDGLLDMYKSGAKELWRNNGNWTFTEVTLPAMTATANPAASWADHDNDGYVDLYVVGENAASDQPDAILNNQGDNTFLKTWEQPSPQFGRGATSCDFDRDGDQDVYVSNYGQQPNLLWQNNGSGVFTDVAAAFNVDNDPTWHASQTTANGHTVGSAWGDINNDGYFDLFVGNFNHHDSRYSDDAIFYQNNAGTGFIEKLNLSGADWEESYFTPAMADYDNDGDLDLFFTTVYDGDDPRLFRNDGGWTFTDVTAAEGLGGLGKTRMAAWGDFDDDGDLDLLTDGRIFVNDESDTGTNHWLKVKLTGDGASVNGAAIGSEVRIDLGGGQILTRQVEGGTGSANQNELTLHFGLGSHAGPVDLEISYGGESVLIGDVAVDQTFAYTVFPLDGDVNGDGFVGGADLTQVIYNWGMTGASHADGDLNGDGTVSGPDYTEIVTSWGNGSPPEPGPIPEPATLSLLLLGCLTLIRRRY